MTALRKDLFVTILGGIAVFATVVLGLALRLVDPLSSTVIPAEDPFTHMGLIRQHLEIGVLQHFDEGIALYPPGMHAFLAAIWVYTGMELAELIRFGPALLGALGVLGMGILLWRHLGPVGGFVGGLGYAVAPEVIFRTTMMSPTALDLALLPFLLYALLEVAAGRMRWIVVAAPMTFYFVFAHPWLLGILALGAGIFFILSILMPGTGTHRPHAHLLGLVTMVTIIGAGLGMTMTGCGGYCGPGMEAFMPTFLHGNLAAAMVIAVFITPALLLAAYPRSLDRFLPRGPRTGVPLWIKLIGSVAIGAIVVLITLPAMARGMPEFVDIPRMFGWPMLAVAAIGLMALPFLPRHIAFIGAGLALTTYPLVIFDVFDSPFWPHRTAVFFGVGLAIMLGVGATAITKSAVALAAGLQTALKRPRRSPHLGDGRPAFSTMLLVPALLVVASLGGTLYTATPESYPGGWYRLYPECEMDALEEISELVIDDPNALIITHSWESRLVIVSFTGKPTKVWFDPPFSLNNDRREDTLANQAREGGAVHVLLDRYTTDKVSDSDLSYLDEPVWQHHETWCAGQGVAQPRIEMYSTGGRPV